LHGKQMFSVFVKCRGKGKCQQWAKNVGGDQKRFIILNPINMRDTFCFSQVTMNKKFVVLCFIVYIIQKKYIYYLTLCDRSLLNFPADFEVLLFRMGLIHCGLF